MTNDQMFVIIVFWTLPVENTGILGYPKYASRMYSKDQPLAGTWKLHDPIVVSLTLWESLFQGSVYSIYFVCDLCVWGVHAWNGSVDFPSPHHHS